MAAGLGFKDFSTGEVLTAADVDGYLMQGIWVFASTAARDASVTSPQEGNFAFTKDTNSLWYYDGAAWVASGATGDIEGVTAGIGISGGGTSGTVTVTNSMATAIDAKGDLVAGTGADTFAKLTVGANDTVLTADSAQATGLKWATPTAAGANFTLLSTTSLSGATTITVSGISGKNQIFIFVSSCGSVNSSTTISLQLNGDTGTNYRSFGHYIIRGDATNVVKVDINQSDMPLCLLETAAQNGAVGILISGCNSSGQKIVDIKGSGATTTNDRAYNTYGIYDSSSTISSISLVSSNGNFDQGNVYVYGSAN